MNTVTTELRSLLTWGDFRAHHKNCGNEFEADLERFLASTMDEVRTATSNRVARAILNLLEIKDFGLFRKSVLRRELTGTIAYPRQRDHSSHTLNNYLLGWYFYRNCAPINGAFAIEFLKRGVGAKSHSFPFSASSEYFGCLWQYTSLLHDIGYMFEGGLPSTGFRSSNEQAAIGAQTARDYFNREIWLDSNLDLAPLRQKLFELLGADLSPPAFDRVDSLADIAENLRHVGSLDALGQAVAEELDKTYKLAVRKPEFDQFSCDAFELWSHHYDKFDMQPMAQRTRSMRKIFSGLMSEGLPRADVRLLDHGVCSGLLLLLAATYDYRIYACARQHTKAALAQRYLAGETWNCAFWWTGIVWATAATAVHNIQQLSHAGALDSAWPGLLPLDEDPLAYLGVLVDIIQEWDRYSVFKALDSEPIQGTEVELGSKAGKILVHFVGSSGPSHAKKLRSNLDEALSDWATVLEIGP